MKATIYIPYASSDPQYDFQYEGEELTPKKYIKMEKDEYNNHKHGVDVMVSTSLGYNMSINGYEKRRIKVKNQSYKSHTCKCNIRNIDGSEVFSGELDRHWINKDQFGLIIYLDQKELDDKYDLGVDLKMWMIDSQKIMNSDRLSEEERIYHLPKKDFKIDFDEGKSHALLKNCKFGKLMTSAKDKFGKPTVSTFGIIVERIIFLKK